MYAFVSLIQPRWPLRGCKSVKQILKVYIFQFIEFSKVKLLKNPTLATM